VIGDIEVFAQCTQKPVVAITGSNGKSTVTSLLGDMARLAKRRVVVAGNIGLPVLDTINEDGETELYILELSSFQLETTYTLNPVAAVILNITEDHMDRYASFAEYQAAKTRIFHGAQTVIVNRDEQVVSQLLDDWPQVPRSYSYSTTLAATQVDFAVIQHKAQNWLAKAGTPLIPVAALKIKGKHNVSNVLAALALGTAVGLPMPAMLEALQLFSGLPHRTQWVAEQDNVVWFNDSKATNVGATIAAVNGLADYRLILLMGGQGKGQDFSALRQTFVGKVKHVYLFGEDAQRIADALGDAVAHSFVKDLKQAVYEAKAVAVAGDAVLLSPACASFDMFNGYEHRGQVFMQLVQEVLA
jgi:UDP-N-acetylmuramoylalanine--D-glutamate ligase